MIDEAIITTIESQTGLSAALIEMVDDEPTSPFVVFDIRTQPALVKEGIAGYTSYVQLKVVDPQLSIVREKGKEVQAALDTMAGQTINGTLIEKVFYTSKAPEEITFQEGEKELTTYIEEIELKIYHKTE